jgi:hypothetical protein
MMKTVSCRSLRQIVLPAVVAALVDTPTLLQMQWISVIDGYDKTANAVTASAMSFDPFTEGSWMLYYVTGRHLRHLKSGAPFESQTFAYFDDQPPAYVRLLHGKNGTNDLPIVVYFDDEASPKLRFRSRMRYESGWAWQIDLDVPTPVLDAILGPNGENFPVEVAYVEPLPNNNSRVVHANLDGPVWRSDTVATISRYVLNTQFIKILRHDATSKSIAVVGENDFYVFYGNAPSWQQESIASSHEPEPHLQGGTLPNGDPFWLRGREFIRLAAVGLIVENLPVDSTSRSARCFSVYKSEDGGLHAFYRVINADHRNTWHYLRRQNNAWTNETLPLQGYFSSGAIITVADTVVIAAGGFYDGRITLLTRDPDGTWQTRLGEAAGDVGNELSLAQDQAAAERAIAYFDRTNGDLKIAYSDNTTYYGPLSNWLVQRVDSVGNVGRLPSALFTNDTLHVAYLDDTNGLLKYGWQNRNGANENAQGLWHAEVIDTIGTVQARFNLLYDSSRRLRIAYQDAGAGEIKMATRIGDGWNVQTISQAQADSPAELRLFQKQDSLCIGFVQNERLKLLVGGRLGENWSMAEIPHLAPAVYATWGTDVDKRIHAVYRTRAGFQDEVRHVYHNGAEWVDRKIFTTSANGMRLHLKQINLYSQALMLALTDDSIPQLYCLSGDSWFRIAHGQRFAGDTALDFLGFGFGTITMYYRALSAPATSYDDQASPELVEDVVLNVVDAIQQAERRRTAAEFSAFPNPFNLMTTIKFNLERPERVTIKIYNTLGQEVRTLTNKTFAPGEHLAHWDGRDDSGRTVSSGVYLARLVSGRASFSRKLVMLK